MGDPRHISGTFVEGNSYGCEFTSTVIQATQFGVPLLGHLGGPTSYITGIKGEFEPLWRWRVTDETLYIFCDSISDGTGDPPVEEGYSLVTFDGTPQNNRALMPVNASGHIDAYDELDALSDLTVTAGIISALDYQDVDQTLELELN